MIAKERITPFLGKKVAVGVPHYWEEDELFFYFGELREVNDDVLVISGTDGYQRIELSEVYDIHEVGDE